ncbi:hypothetical protein RHGRI_010252 [Rhododendron griersonianum]|uniref:S-adenosylmethionine-dependent methyltransferase n=1 Tax=Rhododendron griersonianum TaxID=479676 RepID=A0AAV6KHS9_9ERIC|nr:hypothetical protein RHGRI_010252 [Rhododendron griersonianum]
MIKKTKPTKGTPDSRPMIGGDGANSYTQNSSFQRGVIDGAKGMIFQTIPENIDIHSPPFNPSNAFRIADFGCSTGPNTFVAMQNIIDAVMLKNQSTDQTDPTSTTPEFQVFFNDYIDNDFNTLFKTLPPNRLYFAAGVPGSFHNQLFPRASLHIAHCSYALHWLSRIPPGVTDRGSPAWNKDKIYCAGNKKEVTEAYFGQFQADMDAFLEARAQELVEGGLVVIQIPGVPDCGDCIYGGFVEITVAIVFVVAIGCCSGGVVAAVELKEGEYGGGGRDMAMKVMDKWRDGGSWNDDDGRKMAMVRYWSNGNGRVMVVAEVVTW